MDEPPFTIDHAAIEAILAEAPSAEEIDAIIGQLDALESDPPVRVEWPRCAVCDAEMPLLRRDAVVCGSTCRQRARRARLRRVEES